MYLYFSDTKTRYSLSFWSIIYIGEMAGYSEVSEGAKKARFFHSGMDTGPE
jgi:hypothetical protein